MAKISLKRPGAFTKQKRLEPKTSYFDIHVYVCIINNVFLITNTVHNLYTSLNFNFFLI